MDEETKVVVTNSLFVDPATCGQQHCGYHGQRYTGCGPVTCERVSLRSCPLFLATQGTSPDRADRVEPPLVVVTEVGDLWRCKELTRG